jgi:gas vesicle protein
MSSILNDTLGAAKHVVESARAGTEHAASGARSTLLDGIHTATSIVKALRGLELDKALGWIGLARRRSALGFVVTFGAGVAVGAGVGILFAPMVGADTRRALLNQLKGLSREAKETVEDAEEKAEHLGAKAKEGLKKTGRKIEHKVSQGAEAVKSKAEDVADAVSDAAEDARSFSQADGFSTMDADKRTKPLTGVRSGHRN